MGNIKTLLEVNHSVYRALKGKNDIVAKIGDYELVGYKHDTKSDHGGIAYYNPQDKSVIIAHRGSVTAKDWLVNNPKILLETLHKPLETMADVSAKRFANNILEKLDRNGNQIDNVFHTGHSKGARETQKALIEVADNLKLNTSALTFNSAPCKRTSDREYNHINLQLSGGSIYNSDLVSILGQQTGQNFKVISNQINNPITAHSLNSFSHIVNENNKFVSDDLEKIFDHVRQGKIYFDYPKDILSVDNNLEKSKTIYSLGSLGIDQKVAMPEPELGSKALDNALRNHFDDDFTGQNKDKKFFIDQHTAVVFAEENFKEIKELLEKHSKYSGYEDLDEFMEKSPYFSEFKKENLEKTMNNESNEQQKEIQAQMANYALDSNVYDREFFADMQTDIQNDYAQSEVYIFLSDSDSQCVVYRSDMFMGDQNSEMQSELESKVFDRVEQVEDYLEANESLLQQKVSRLNVVDGRANPQALMMKGMLQNRLNNVRGDIAELKPFHSVTATPLGTDKNHVILVDTKSDMLYSVSKSKLIGHDIDLDDILKNHKKVELFNNGNSIETKQHDNTLHNVKVNDNVKHRSSEKGLELD